MEWILAILLKSLVPQVGKTRQTSLLREFYRGEETPM